MRPRLFELCFELHGLVVKHRELGLQALVLGCLDDDVLRQRRQLHLEAFHLLQAALVVLVGRLLEIKITHFRSTVGI